MLLNSDSTKLNVGFTLPLFSTTLHIVYPSFWSKLISMFRALSCLEIPLPPSVILSFCFRKFSIFFEFKYEFSSKQYLCSMKSCILGVS